MDDMTRRDMLRSAAAVGAFATMAAAPSMAMAGQSTGQTTAAVADQGQQSEAVRRGILEAAAVADQCQWSEAEKKDRQRVIAAGFTEDEASCWLLVNRAAAKFLSLPELHPSDIPEFTVVFHAVQTKLLSRPVYRKYRELAGLSVRPR